jgi:DNA polymerase III subunit beta
MELTVARTDLQKELQLCQGVVEKRSTIPILSNVLLRATGERLEIAATDLDVTIQASCAATVRSEGAITIEARRFFDVIRSLTDDELKLVVDEGDSLRVESGSARFKLLGLPADDFPSLPEVDISTAHEVDLDDLKTMIEKVIFAITHEETRFQLNGALLKLVGDRLEMVATDGHRMALVTFPQEGLEIDEEKPVSMLIPRKALQELARLDSSDDARVRFGISENHLFFQSGSRLLMGRMIEVNFPNYMDVISRDNTRRVVVDRERLASTIRRISLLANERTRAIRFEFEPGKLTVSSTNSELGDARETVPVDYSGEGFFIGLNAGYMADFLSAVDTDSVSLDLKDEGSQCIGKPLGKETLPYDYLYVVMPMRI